MTGEPCRCPCWESRVLSQVAACLRERAGPSKDLPRGPVSQGALCLFAHPFVHLFILKDERQRTFTAKREARLEIGRQAAWGSKLGSATYRLGGTG